MSLKGPQTIFFIAFCVLLAACSGDAAKHTERATSPLIGSWVRDGDTPAPDAKNPQFTKLTFSDDGTLAAQYVAAGGVLAGIVKKSPKIETESDTYTLVGDKHVKIVEGSTSRDFNYDVHDGKLYLTSSGGEATTFSKAQTGWTAAGPS